MNAATIQQRQDAVATADVWDLENCVGLPNYPLSVDRSSAGECKSYENFASSLKLRSLNDPACQRKYLRLPAYLGNNRANGLLRT